MKPGISDGPRKKKKNIRDELNRVPCAGVEIGLNIRDGIVKHTMTGWHLRRENAGCQLTEEFPMGRWDDFPSRTQVTDGQCSGPPPGEQGVSLGREMRRDCRRVTRVRVDQWDCGIMSWSCDRAGWGGRCWNRPMVLRHCVWIDGKGGERGVVHCFAYCWGKVYFGWVGGFAFVCWFV